MAKKSLTAAKSEKKSFTSEMQEELDELALHLVDVNELVTEKSKVLAYKVPINEENLIHLQIISGFRYNPNTGEEETKPSIKKFTYGEYQVFKANYKLLGYTIVKVLHDPFNVVEVTNKK